MNILLVNLGRHVALYEQLLKSGFGPASIYMAENDIGSASCVMNKASTNIKILRALDDGFIRDLLSLCKEKKIDYLFSFIDYGMDKLAKHKASFDAIGTRVVVSSHETVVMCEDKYVFSRHMEKKNIATIPTFLDAGIKNFFGFPYFAKPRYGNSSTGVSVINNEDDLKHYISKPDYIVQPYLKDREFGADLLVKNGKIYDLFIKEKLSLRAGTTDKAVSVWSDDIFDLMVKLNSAMEFDGPIDIDITEKDKKYFINEVNPRFGGGYASAIFCGKNYFLRYINDLKNDNFKDYKLGIRTVRYETTVGADAE